MSKDLISYVGGVQIANWQFVADLRRKALYRRIAVALAREVKKKGLFSEVKEVASASASSLGDFRRHVALKVSRTIRELDKKGTEAGVHIQVIKNSLAKLAFEGTDFGCSDEVLTGPSLVCFFI